MIKQCAIIQAVDIRENVNLSSYSTMRLGGPARWLAEAGSDEELQKLIGWANDEGHRFIVIGGGSNIVWRDEGFDGLVIVNKIHGKEILYNDDKGAIVRLGAGENWDSAVDWTITKGLSGLEFLSHIPGTVGAAPVQNIGAYGAEISQVLKSVGVYDTQTNSFESMLNESCGFSYRSSRFKAEDKGRFAITHIVLTLKKQNPAPPFYESLQSYLSEHNVADYTPASIRQAVIEIRKIRLPDPSEVANNGSFFTNPIVDQGVFERLKRNYPEVKCWPAEEGKVKLSAGWLLEQAGFKGAHDSETGMATWPNNALVIVNEHAGNTADLLKFKQKILNKVQSMFGLKLEQEPEILP